VDCGISIEVEEDGRRRRIMATHYDIPPVSAVTEVEEIKQDMVGWC